MDERFVKDGDRMDIGFGSSWLDICGFCLCSSGHASQGHYIFSLPLFLFYPLCISWAAFCCEAFRGGKRIADGGLIVQLFSVWLIEMRLQSCLGGGGGGGGGRFTPK